MSVTSLERDSKQDDVLTKSIVTKYRSIINAKWQSWEGFTGALFGESRDDRNFCRVTYHFDSSCKALACVNHLYIGPNCGFHARTQQISQIF